MDQGRVDVVDAVAEALQFGLDGRVDPVHVRRAYVGPGVDGRRVVGIRDPIAPAAWDRTALLFAEPDGAVPTRQANRREKYAGSL
ncbi:hypothetical protein GCM10020367_15830 [Streptomyces sannanensis]|uniref:Uncharacterized protein n=1 Tax=Streptomyces sannanensis TaxID=285536 RepID=A0ABP6S7Z3_9ACTN